MKSLEDLEKAFETGLNAWEKEIADKHAGQMGQKVVREVKQITPVGDTGNLRRSWFCKIDKENNQIIIRICNPTEYAPLVNYGHRLVRNGKTVGKVNGKQMLEKGIAEYQKSYMKKDVEAMLKELRKAMQ